MGWAEARLSRRQLSCDIGAVTRRRHPGSMSRPAMSEANLHARAVQAARRMIARGERPGYRLLLGGDGPMARGWTARHLRGGARSTGGLDVHAHDDRHRPRRGSHGVRCRRVRNPAAVTRSPRPGHASGPKGPANWGERAGPKQPYRMRLAVRLGKRIRTVNATVSRLAGCVARSFHRGRIRKDPPISLMDGTRLVPRSSAGPARTSPTVGIGCCHPGKRRRD